MTTALEVCALIILAPVALAIALPVGAVVAHLVVVAAVWTATGIRSLLDKVLPS